MSERQSSAHSSPKKWDGSVSRLWFLLFGSGMWRLCFFSLLKMKAALSSNLIWKEEITQLIYMFVLVLSCFTSFLLTAWQLSCHSFSITHNVPLCLTVEHFQTTVFYWDLRVFLLDPLAQLTTLHKWTKENKQGNRRHRLNNGRKWVTYNELTDL